MYNSSSLLCGCISTALPITRFKISLAQSTRTVIETVSSFRTETRNAKLASASATFVTGKPSRYKIANFDLRPLLGRAPPGACFTPPFSSAIYSHRSPYCLLPLPCLALPCLASPSRAWPCRAKPRLALPCPAMPCLATPRLAASYILTLPRLASPRHAQPRHALPCPAAPCRVVYPYLALPRLAVPCLAEPRLALPGHATPRRVVYPYLALPRLAVPSLAVPGHALPGLAAPSPAPPRRVGITQRQTLPIHTDRKTVGTCQAQSFRPSQMPGADFPMCNTYSRHIAQ